MFIQPRDFITFCTHKWSHDGTQLILSQACYDDYKGIIDNNGNDDGGGDEAGAGGNRTGSRINNNKNKHPLDQHVQKNKIPLHPNGPRAYALRGATYIRRNPKDPENSTRIYIVAHCDCGEDIPQWAVKTAVSILAPIKPFEIIHRINVGITTKWDKHKAWKKYYYDYQQQQHSARAGTDAGADTSDINNDNNSVRRPAGFAQMGYGAFWPNGGGPTDPKSSTEMLDVIDKLYP